MPAQLESIRCEAYGPGGAVLIIDGRTDDRGRTVGEIRRILQMHGGHLGARGSVSYMFNPVGRLVYSAGTDAARLAVEAVRAGAEDVVPATLEVLTDPIDFETVRWELEAAGFIPTCAEVTQRASMTVPLGGEAAVSMVHLIQALKNLNEVETVHTNAEIPDEVLARI